MRRHKPRSTVSVALSASERPYMAPWPTEGGGTHDPTTLQLVDAGASRKRRTHQVVIPWFDIFIIGGIAIFVALTIIGMLTAGRSSP